jgi:hypothetical protein
MAAIINIKPTTVALRAISVIFVLILPESLKILSVQTKKNRETPSESSTRELIIIE